MRSILLDESVPIDLADFLHPEARVVRHVFDVGLSGKSDGELLLAASRDGIDVFITCDQHLVRQQNVAVLPFGIVVLCTNNWATIFVNRVVIEQAADSVRPGTFVRLLERAHVTRYGRRPRRDDPAP